MKTDKQTDVLRYLQTVEQATLKEIYANVSFGYYCNEMKHLGVLMARMVKNGKAKRIKAGVFTKGSGFPPTEPNPNQTILPINQPKQITTNERL